jgi:hypothetical protein
MAWRFFKPVQDMIVIDKTVKNPWNWQWLSRNINNGKKKLKFQQRLGASLDPRPISDNFERLQNHHCALRDI